MYQISPKQKWMEKSNIIYQCLPNSEGKFVSRIIYTIIYQLTPRNNLRYFGHARTQFASYPTFLEEEKNLIMYASLKKHTKESNTQKDMGLK